MLPLPHLVSCLLFAILMAGCKPAPTQSTDIRVRLSGKTQLASFDEISGIQASRRHAGVYWVLNDSGKPKLHALDITGKSLGTIKVPAARLEDWEDMALIPQGQSDILVLADMGDNNARRSDLMLYLVEEPRPGADGTFSGSTPVLNQLSVRYPDGPRDLESIAWDPVNEELLFLSKRNEPPHLYVLDRETLLRSDSAVLEFLGEVTSFRPPAIIDAQTIGKRWHVGSQPTGMDISPDGQYVAIITYRSLYLFQRAANADWLATLNTEPLEIIGPPHDQEEAIGFSRDGQSIIVTAEGFPAPVYQFIDIMDHLTAPADVAGSNSGATD